MSRGIGATISVFVIGILVVAAGFFLLGIERTALNCWAFGSLLFSLIVSLFATITLVAPEKNNNGLFYNAGLSGAIWIYEVLVIISILFTKAFAERLNSFVFLQIGLNALVFIAVIVIITASRHVRDSNARTYEKQQSGEYNKPKRGGF
ncbi:MAG: hypothetical protein LBQ42_04895 [Synergistaceae bacterium]|jgi:hypothetical protein|nr:hypothetical protein [Synergistaceae bacterium]